MSALGFLLAIYCIILFAPKERKKPKLTLHRGDKYDPDEKF